MPHTHPIQFRLDAGGAVRVRNATVTVYRVTASAPEKVAEVVADGDRFEVSLPASTDPYFYYAVAYIHEISGAGDRDPGKRIIQWVAVFKPGAHEVTMSPRVDVATAYAFARFTEIGEGMTVTISDPHQALHLAYAMKNNFVADDGAVSPVIECSPNGFETNSWALFNFLANVDHYALVDAAVYRAFTGLTGGGSTFGALHALARDPFTDPQAIYDLVASRPQVYAPSLPDLREPATPVPDQWTLTVKVNDSGAENFLIAGVGYGAFDKYDRLWLTNNTRQGTPNSSTFCVVLEPGGKPAPFSPLFGGGVLGSGFGVAADPAGETIYVGNYGWGPSEWNPQHGSVSAFSHDGEVLSPSQGWTAGLSRVQGMAVDDRGNLWMASWGTQDPMPYTDSRFRFEDRNSAIVVYLGGDPERVRVHEFDHPSPRHRTFDVVCDEEGNAYVSNSGYKGDQDRGLDPVPSSVYKFRLEGDELCRVACWVSPNGNETLRQITLGPDGDVYVGAVGTSRVVHLSTDLEYRGELTNEIHGPWGVLFDRDGTLYVSNFTRDIDFTTPTDEPIGPYGVTVIRDLDDTTAHLMTVPTGGHEVTLANGLPLYGNGSTVTESGRPPESHDPIMRLTGSRIDRAGNLWACNNWKPSAYIDVVQGDPGGDGMVVYVGVAAPAQRRDTR
jgi:sugar lactone lactonase YvrE